MPAQENAVGGRKRCALATERLAFAMQNLRRTSSHGDDGDNRNRERIPQ
jgi:hypothetical protein